MLAVFSQGVSSVATVCLTWIKTRLFVPEVLLDDHPCPDNQVRRDTSCGLLQLNDCLFSLQVNSPVRYSSKDSATRFLWISQFLLPSPYWSLPAVWETAILAFSITSFQTTCSSNLHLFIFSTTSSPSRSVTATPLYKITQLVVLAYETIMLCVCVCVCFCVFVCPAILNSEPTARLKKCLWLLDQIRPIKLISFKFLTG